MKATGDKGMKNNLTFIHFVILITILLTSSQRTPAQATFDFPGGFSYSLNMSEDSVFDLTPDNRIAVILTSADSPAAGRVCADLILKGRSDLIDASQLSVERFEKGQLLEETAVL